MRRCSGDTTMGNIDLQRVAASAIVAVNEQAQTMHDDTVANLHLFYEDMARLWVELWQVYSPNGMTVVMTQQVKVPVTQRDPITGQDVPVIDPMTGQPQTRTEEVEVPVEITAEELDALKPNIRIDVTKDTAFNVEARQNEADKLLEMGQISLEEWVTVSEASTIQKTDYELIISKRKEQAQAMPQMPIQESPE